LLLTNSCFAAGLGVTGGEFLRLGVGERAIGMGGAFCSIANNVSSTYWNPAGLAQLSSRELSMMSFDYLMDISNENYSYANPLGNSGVLGFQISLLGMRDMSRDEYGTMGSFFKNEERIVSLSYASWINPNLSMGINLKTIYTKLDTDETSGFGMDIGTLYKTPVENLNLGVVIQNIETGLKYTDKKESMPLNLKTGISYTLNNVILATDVDAFIDNSINLHTGGEYTYKPMQRWNLQLSARLGYSASMGNINAISGLSSGFGLKINKFNIDYAFVPHGDLGDTKRISFTARF